MSNKKNPQIDNIVDILAKADETYAAIPHDAKLALEKVVSGMPEFGPRKLRQKGPGYEFYEARPFREGVDDPRMLSARLSARHGRRIAVERQAEKRQPVFLWRKGYGSTTISYDPSRWTKKNYMEIALLACAMSITKNEDMIGALEGEKTFRSGSAATKIASQFYDVNVIPGNMPVINRKVPVDSTAILMSDFFARPEEQAEMEKAFDDLAGRGINGTVCMVVDPAEVDFDIFKGHTRFHGKQGEKVYDAKKADALRPEFNKAVNKYIDWVENLARSNGYNFILQRTDEDPRDLVLKIFGVSPEGPAPALKL